MTPSEKYEAYLTTAEWGRAGELADLIALCEACHTAFHERQKGEVSQ